MTICSGFQQKYTKPQKYVGQQHLATIYNIPHNNQSQQTNKRHFLWHRGWRFTVNDGNQSLISPMIFLGITLHLTQGRIPYILQTLLFAVDRPSGGYDIALPTRPYRSESHHTGVMRNGPTVTPNRLGKKCSPSNQKSVGNNRFEM